MYPDLMTWLSGDKGEEVPLQGGVKFSMGPLGSMYTRNLTPDPQTGLGRYSDEQIFRMMRHDRNSITKYCKGRSAIAVGVFLML